LIARGDIDRLTRDLDFFGPSSQEVDRLVPEAERALREAGLSVHRVREGSGFYRLEVEDGGEATEVDFGADFRLLPIDRWRTVALDLTLDRLHQINEVDRGEDMGLGI
jgi:hypothetical protein